VPLATRGEYLRATRSAIAPKAAHQRDPDLRQRLKMTYADDRFAARVLDSALELVLSAAHPLGGCPVALYSLHNAAACDHRHATGVFMAWVSLGAGYSVGEPIRKGSRWMSGCRRELR
jgi:hypothetical protein